MGAILIIESLLKKSIAEKRLLVKLFHRTISAKGKLSGSNNRLCDFLKQIQ